MRLDQRTNASARVGVLALQGDFAEHIQAVRSVGAEAWEVRLPQELEQVDALIIPGGESTTMRRLMDLYQLAQPICRRVREGMPVWGTCAGMILLANRLTDDRPEPLHLMDIEVSRNAYGRQVDSFETEVLAPALGPAPVPAVFIRAPLITQVGPGVDVLARLPEGSPVAVLQGFILATAFHPELTPDTRFHSYFVGLARRKPERPNLKPGA